MTPGSRSAALGVVMAAIPAVAHAHLVTSGMGPLYDGVLHLLVSPGELLGLVTLALLAGLVGRRAGRLAVLLLPTTWLAGGLVSLGVGAELSADWSSAVSLVLLGGLVAFDARLPPSAVGALAALFGGLHGLLDGAALGAEGAAWPAVVGIALGVALLVLWLSAVVVSLELAWARVAIRVVGSWMAAVGLLLLGWLARGSG